MTALDDDRERQYWNRHARGYDLSMLLFGGPIPRMLELVERAAQGAEAALEIGAGTGIVTVALSRAARSVVATDYAEAMVTSLRERVRREALGNVEVRRADVYALPFDDAAFDVVVAANVLHLVPDLRGALAAIRRVLRPGGRFALPTYCHDETTRARIASRLLALTGFPGHRRFTVRSLRAAIEAEGLEVERVETLRGLIPIGYVEGVRQPAPVRTTTPR